MATLPGEVAISGTAYERDLNLAIAVREASLGKVGGIPMLPCEAVLVPELCDSAEMSLVPQHLIAGVVDFREMLINDIEKKRATTLAKQLDVLRTNWEAYSQCDRFLAIEKSIMEKAQSSVDDKIKSQILARLPSPDKPKLTPGDCLVRVQAIVAHNLYSFANTSLQDQIDLVAETLQLMKDGVSPSDAFGEGQPFLKSVHTTLQHFVRADWVDDEGEPAEKSGQDALTHRFDDVKNRLDKPGPTVVAPLIRELEVFNEFEYLLLSSQKKALPDMIKRVLALVIKPGEDDLHEMDSLTASSSTALPASKKKSSKSHL
jgi:hypothetical protein